MDKPIFLSLDSRAETTSVKNPKELCSFSRTFDGEYTNDDSSLSYYFLPDSEIDTNIDLGAGFQKFKKFDEARDGEMNGYLSALQKYETDHNTKIKADIVTWRGIMTKLLVLPYNLHDPIDLIAVYFDGHIFIQQDKYVKRVESQDKKFQRVAYSGYKFENVATLPKPLNKASRSTIDKNSKKIVNNIEQYGSIVRTGIGKKKLVIAGEVDCVWDYKPEDSNPLRHYVELKTTKIITEPKHALNFEKKLFRTWAQTFLLGINRIVYGFRDDDLILRSVEEYKTEEIPLLLKNSPFNNSSRKTNCIDALKWYGAVVDWIVDHFPKDESKAFKISYDPNNKTFSMFELTADRAQSVLNDEILTKEFRDWRLSKRAS